MFRLIAANTGSTLRPILLRNVRTTRNNLVKLESNFQRQNSVRSPDHKFQWHTLDVDGDFAADKQEPRPDTNASLTRFEELLLAATQDRKPLGAKVSATHYDTVRSLYDLFRDDAVKEKLLKDDIWQYTQLLNDLVYLNRVLRLARTSNRDTDQYNSTNLNTDVLLKNALLHLAENILSGSLRLLVDPRIVRIVIQALFQYKENAEIVKVWELGVNDPEVSSVYLQPQILSVVLPVLYEDKRLTYEQILELYNKNVQRRKFVFHELLASMGKVCIREGDYSRGLDFLESLLSSYEGMASKSKMAVLKSLAELHLLFIGLCKDITIAKNFFDKVISGNLPYRVILKAPHVVSLLENCHDANEPLDELVKLWMTATTYYDNYSHAMNSRYAMLNHAFFSIFFRRYPAASAEGLDRLRTIISQYAQQRRVDELLLNNIVSNYSWNDKAVLEQLIENYDLHQVQCTPVANRVILKKCGVVQDYTPEEILAKWNSLLRRLDELNFSYIPIADWAALRDATLMSDYAADRKALYLSVLDAYKDFHQDERAVQRFVKWWLDRKPRREVARVTLEPQTDFKLAYCAEVPEYKNLRRNVDYVAVSKKMFSILE